MTKEEALKRIEELKKFVEGRPEPKEGQVWRHRSGAVYLLARTTLICIRGHEVGKCYCSDSTFSYNEDHFTYVGMANDVLEVK